MEMRTIFLLTLLKLCRGDTSPCQTDDVFPIILPAKVEALAGSCVVVPCVVNVSHSCEEKLEQSELVSAVWLRGEPMLTKMFFNSTQKVTKGFDRIEVIGDLRQRNCTTIFYNIHAKHKDKYFFRIESYALKYIYTKPFHLSVKDSPSSPYVTGPLEVAEGSVVTLSCSAAAPCPYHPPTLTWSYQTANTYTHSHVQDGNGRRNLTSFLTFTASRSHHGREIFCIAFYFTQKQNTVEKRSNGYLVTVQFPPKVMEASVSPSGAVAEGSSVTLSCNSSEANPPVHNYTWYKDTQSSPVGSGPNITFNISSSDAGLYYCRAEHPLRAESAKVRLAVKGLPVVLKVAGGVLGAVLFCALIGFAFRMKRCKTFRKDKKGALPRDPIVHSKDEAARLSAPSPSTELQDEEDMSYGDISFSRAPSRASSRDLSEGQGPQGPQGPQGQGPGQDREPDYSGVLVCRIS